MDWELDPQDTTEVADREQDLAAELSKDKGLMERLTDALGLVDEINQERVNQDCDTRLTLEEIAAWLR